MGSKAERNISFSPPDISELEINEVANAMRSGWITTGPRTKLLEKRLERYIETGFVDERDFDEMTPGRVVCLSSATASEEMNLRMLGIGPGDEVIVPAYTYTSTASAVVHCGARVVFADIQKDGNPDTKMPEVDYNSVEKAITEKTKAVISVDLGGIPADYAPLYDIIERKKGMFSPCASDGTPLGDLSHKIQSSLGRITVLSDSAHALGASRNVDGEWKFCGDIADFSSFSFHAVKNFTTAEGGAAVWRSIEGINNSEIYRMYQLLSLHGQSKDAFAKTKAGAWEYDIVMPAYKCNMTDITAGIGLAQLDRYPSLVKRREEIISKYNNMCDSLGVQRMVHNTTSAKSSNHLYIVRLPGIDESVRNKLIDKMSEYGVATNVHYKPLPMMTAYKSLGWDIKDFPNAYDYYKNEITLPLHTLLTDEDVEYVCDMFKKAYGEVC